MNLFLEESNSPDFYTLSGLCVWRRCGVFEGSVPYEPRPVIFAVVGLEQNDLLGGHLREIPPLVFVVVPHDVVLADAVSIAKVELEEVIGRRRGHVAHCERAFFDNIVDWLPDVEEGDAAREKVVGLVGEELAHAQWSGLIGIVTMHEHHRSALARVGFLCQFLGYVRLSADGVVEDQDAVGADSLLEKLNNFGVELFADKRIVLPVRIGSMEVVERESFFIFREFFGAMPTVGKRHLMRVIAWLVDAGCVGRLVKVQLGELVTKVLCVVDCGTDGALGLAVGPVDAIRSTVSMSSLRKKEKI